MSNNSCKLPSSFKSLKPVNIDMAQLLPMKKNPRAYISLSLRRRLFLSKNASDHKQIRRNGVRKKDTPFSKLYIINNDQRT